MSWIRMGCAAAALAAVTARAQDRPVRAIPDSIRVDGILDEKYWRGQDTLLLVRNNPAGGAPRAATRVLTAWSPTHLYAALIAETGEVKGTYTRHDDPLYNQDVLELFLDPGGDGKDYLEFEWNCLNTALELRCRGIRDCDEGWSPAGLRSAVTVQGTANKSGDLDTGWTLEIAIPWAALPASPSLPPAPGGRLPANFYRIDTPAGGAMELSAWSPTGAADFHRPDKFGVLVFAGSSGLRFAHQRRGSGAAGIATVWPWIRTEGRLITLTGRISR